MTSAHAGGKTLHFSPNKLVLQTLLSLQNDAGSPAPILHECPEAGVWAEGEALGDRAAKGMGEQY